jgi:hypothetical protein
MTSTDPKGQSSVGLMPLLTGCENADRDGMKTWSFQDSDRFDTKPLPHEYLYILSTSWLRIL